MVRERHPLELFSEALAAMERGEKTRARELLEAVVGLDPHLRHQGLNPADVLQRLGPANPPGLQSGERRRMGPRMWIALGAAALLGLAGAAIHFMHPDSHIDADSHITIANVRKLDQIDVSPPLPPKPAVPQPHPLAPVILSVSQHPEKSLIFMNKPFRLLAEHLLNPDLGNRTLMSAPGVRGTQRVLFQHCNGTDFPIGYRVKVYNPDQHEVQVSVRGATLLVEEIGAMATALSGDGQREIRIAGTASNWIFDGKREIRPGACFSGASEFTVNGGSVALYFEAYRIPDNQDKSVPSLNIDVGEPRHYKGIIRSSEVTIALDPIQLDDQVLPGPVSVSYQRYDLGRRAWVDSKASSDWCTNIRPDFNPNAVAADLTSIKLDNNVVDPLIPDGSSLMPNLGNWGVIYHVKTHIINKGSNPRSITFKLTATSDTKEQGGMKAEAGNSVVSYISPDDGMWHTKRLTGSALPPVTMSVPPTKQQGTTFLFQFVLEEGSGNLCQQFSIDD